MDAGWTVKVSEQSPQQAIYRRELPTKTHTLVASVALVQLDKSVPLVETLAPHGFENSHPENGTRWLQPRETAGVRRTSDNDAG
jgi:hypothetical protein